MEHLNIEKNKWFVYYTDEDGEKYNRGFATQVQANVFANSIMENGGVLLKIYQS